MPTNLNDSYDELRKEILARVGLSPISAAQLFHAWEYNSRVPARAQAAELSRLSQHWLLAGDPSATHVTERVVVDRFLHALPRPLRQAAGMRNPQTFGELVEAIELAEATQGWGASTAVSPGGCSRSDARRRAPPEQSAGRRFPARKTNQCPRNHLGHLTGPGWRAVSSIRNHRWRPLRSR